MNLDQMGVVSSGSMNTKILKRLELIKTAISIEDEEIIELQVIKLNAIECDEKVVAILHKIENEDYVSVIFDIEAYIQNYNGLVVYEDKEVQGLRLELKVLERKLQELSAEKNECLNDINDFNVQYHLHLGEIIQKILNLKEELLREASEAKKKLFNDLKDEYNNLKEEFKKTKSQKESLEQELEYMDEFDDAYEELYEELKNLKEELNYQEEKVNNKRKEAKQAKDEYEEDEVSQEYEEVKRDNEEFYKEHEEVIKEERIELNDEEKAELKKVFRKASRLCHPDLVTDDLKEQAHEMIQKLNDAYAKHDLEAIKEMLVLLESGRGFDIASDTITDKVLLREKIINIREMIHSNEAELETLKENDVVQILADYEVLQSILMH